MFNNKKLLLVEKTILDMIEEVDYPQLLKELENIWSCIFLTAISQHDMKNIKIKDQDNVKKATYPIMIIRNTSSIKVTTREYALSSVKESFENSLKSLTFKEFCIFWSDEVLKFQINLEERLYKYIGMHKNIEKLQFKFQDLYLKEAEKLILTHDSQWPQNYKSLLIDLFYPYENLLIIEDILQKPPESQEKVFNEILIWISEEIQINRRIIIPDFPESIFQRYLMWFLKGIKKSFKEKLITRDENIKNTFIDHSTIFIIELTSGEKKVFDRAYCSNMSKSLIATLVLKISPNELRSDPILLKLLESELEFNCKFFQVEDISPATHSKLIKDLREQTTEICRNFILTSIVFMIFDSCKTKSQYLVYFREFICQLIKNFLFPYSNAPLNSSIILHLESLATKYLSSQVECPGIIKGEAASSGSAFSFLSSKKKEKSMKLVNIFPNASYSALIIIPSQNISTSETFKKTEIFKSISNQCETFVYKWNPHNSFTGVIQVVPNLINAGYNAYLGNIVAACRNTLGALVNTDLNAFKTHAKAAASNLLKMIMGNELKNKPISIFAEEGGCQVAYYFLKELCRTNMKVHNVFLIYNDVSKKSWKVYKASVLGRFVNCAKKEFSPMKLALFKNPVDIIKIENAENIEIPKKGLEPAQIVEIIRY